MRGEMVEGRPRGGNRDARTPSVRRPRRRRATATRRARGCAAGQGDVERHRSAAASPPPDRRARVRRARGGARSPGRGRRSGPEVRCATSASARWRSGMPSSSRSSGPNSASPRTVEGRHAHRAFVAVEERADRLARGGQRLVDARAAAARASPAAVRVSTRPRRAVSGTGTRACRWASCCDTADAETCSAAATAATLPRSPSSRSVRRCTGSISSNLRDREAGRRCSSGCSRRG